MDAISSVQTIGNSIDVANSVQPQDSNQGITKQTLSFHQSLTVDDGAKIPLDFNIIETPKVKNDIGVSQKLTQGISEINSDYQNIITRLNTWPDFDGYLEKRGISPSSDTMDKNMGITHVSNIDDIKAAEETAPLSTQEVLDEKQRKVDALQKEQQEYYSAGIEYSQDSTRWSMNSTFWLSKVKILTSAVSEVSSGLKTLFMSQ